MEHRCKHEEDFGAVKADIEHIKSAIDKIMNNHLVHIQDRLQAYCPMWATVLITILGSITTGLIVRLVSRG